MQYSKGVGRVTNKSIYYFFVGIYPKQRNANPPKNVPVKTYDIHVHCLLPHPLPNEMHWYLPTVACVWGEEVVARPADPAKMRKC